MLTSAKLQRLAPADKPKKHTDGRGLYLLIRPDGGRSWRFDYRFAGKRKTLSLGTYPDVSLKAARAAHEGARHAIRQGIDPAAAKQANKRAQRLQVGGTFADAARDWLASRRPALSKKTYVNRHRLIEGRLIPALGAKPIAALTPADVLVVLRDLERDGKHSLARRVRQMVGQIFRRALVDGQADRDPTVGLKGALAPYVETNRAAITDPAQIGGLLRAIDGYHGSPVVRAALQFLALTFVRPGEVRHALWAEIDPVAKVWRIPAAKMKSRNDHLVPLAPQAIAVLEAVKLFAQGSAFVFPAVRSTKRPLSEMTLMRALQALGYTSEQMTAHGFRAMARTRIDESLRYPPEVIEIQLAHVMPGALGATYARAKYIEIRTKMMSDWADLLDVLRKG